MRRIWIILSLGMLAIAAAVGLPTQSSATATCYLVGAGSETAAVIADGNVTLTPGMDVNPGKACTYAIWVAPFSTLNLQHVIVENGKSADIFASVGSTVNLTNGTVLRYADHGVYAQAATINANGVTAQWNWDGFFVTAGSTLSVVNNSVVQNNHLNGIREYNSTVMVDSSTVDYNGGDGVFASQGTVNTQNFSDLSYNGGNGIYAQLNTNVNLLGGTIFHNSLDGASMNGAGIVAITNEAINHNHTNGVSLLNGTAQVTLTSTAIQYNGIGVVGAYGLVMNAMNTQTVLQGVMIQLNRNGILLVTKTDMVALTNSTFVCNNSPYATFNPQTNLEGWYAYTNFTADSTSTLCANFS